MRIGYNTNGFAHHRLEDAIEILAEIGYRSVAITIDYDALNPFDPASTQQLARVRDLLRRHQLGCVVETGARFLLDPRRKHYPTLLDADPGRRRVREDFLRHAIRLAEELQADAVSFWSGALPAGVEPDPAMERLAASCRSLAEAARDHGVHLAFEPEPGMFIDTMASFAELHRRVDHSAFGLTLDVGHVHCLSDGDVCEHIRRWRDGLFNFHFEDMRRGLHDHLPLGEGEMDLSAILRCLHGIGYPGGVHVELSRHSHDAVRVARQAFEYIARAMAL